MEYKSEIDQVTAATWHEQMALFDDANVYQTWSYGAIRWGAKNLSHLVLRRDGEIVAMAQLRIIRSRVAGGVAYLRWGPMCQLRGRGLELETVKQVAAALHAEYVKKRRLFLRILPNAFIGSERERIFSAAFPQFKRAAATPANTDRTFLVDISPSREEIRKKLDQKWRNQLNRAEKNNLTLIEGSGAVEYKRFLEVYEKMWSRKQFETSVDVNEFARLNDDLPPQFKFKILICEHEGTAVSAMVASAIGNMGIYLLGATHDEGLNTKAAYLIHWTMINRLKESGVQSYDLGGINPETNPGVYHFKRGFSGDDVTRIAPLECCEDLVSSVVMRAADLARGGLKGMAGKFKRKTAVAVPAEKAQEKPASARANPCEPVTPEIDISVVILSWNDQKYLEECLHSLENSTKTRRVEIIVVDNASTDGSPDIVAAKFPHVTLIRNAENLGFPKGNNVGMRASRGKYVYLLNSDVKVLPGCMDALADYMDAHPDIGMIGPRILNGDMTHQSSCRRFPTLWNNFCVMSGLAGALKSSKIFCGEHMFYFKGDKLIDVDVLVGCFWAVRREAIDQFGMLDEGFFMYAEDLDWCKRCWEGGWRVVFYPDAQSIHYRGGSSAKKDPVWLALTQQRSVLRYWKKHHGAMGVFGMSCLIFANKCVRCVAASINYLTRPSKRQDSLVRIQVARASLRALFSSSKTESV